ncbi:hypothetical protein BCR37DRAFT_397895 [Protomyces lactucae-debilis]|uniref:Mitochondrial import inner membrane translocase subunit Tim21 n=1 Tax=Protomyces lactucae-debilis TaxID=2754530 RepID=A0A1Y2FI42_PROLT|nr:uncharacterized protein BCR37DRAFT_397895 [Protomyces lactucae-debilis]ORY83619.1 hypothetical protein BCR37DRAFT_397895 [Protomyces lactucae-debilis]
MLKYYSARSLSRASSKLLLRRPINATQHRLASTTAEQPSSVDAPGAPQAVQRTAMQKVGRATATGGYAVVVAGGIALVVIVFWALGSNLFFETRYLNEAVDLVKAHPEVKRLIGHDLNAYGERSRNGRRGGPVPSQRSADGHQT